MYAQAIPAPLDADAVLPVPWSGPELDTPALLIDLDVLDANVAEWADLAARKGVVLRPHVKTHKSVQVARRQMAAGAAGITASSVTEALAMAAGGIDDVLIAYPLLGQRKLDRLQELIALAEHVRVVADDPVILEGYQRVADATGRSLEVLVEVDTGMHRIGIAGDAVIDLAERIAATPSLDFTGMMTHAGHAHDAQDARGIRTVARAEARRLAELTERLTTAGLPPRVVSAGSTLTARYLSSEDGITEIRPGTYVFNDIRTLEIGACDERALAATILATVVSSDGAGRVTIDAGSKTLTTAASTSAGFGRVEGYAGGRVQRLSEEHGVLQLDGAVGQPKIGDRLRIVPAHVCPCVDLQREVYGVRGGEVAERITVDAMRHSL